MPEIPPVDPRPEPPDDATISIERDIDRLIVIARRLSIAFAGVALECVDVIPRGCRPVPIRDTGPGEPRQIPERDPRPDQPGQGHLYTAETPVTEHVVDPIASPAVTDAAGTPVESSTYGEMLLTAFREANRELSIKTACARAGLPVNSYTRGLVRAMWRAETLLRGPDGFRVNPAK